MAQIELRYEKLSLFRPANVVQAEKYPSELEVYDDHVKERAESVSHGEKPIE